MLSTVNDFRPGTYSDQHHVWQATLSEDAIVFSTLPKNEPFPGADWPDDDAATGRAGGAAPLGPDERTGDSLYAPHGTRPRRPAPAGRVRVPVDYTHAWFPTERFDEVVRDGQWTFGREGDGYVALWSPPAVDLRKYAPRDVFTDGLTEPFDLVAPGGSDNVWIAEVGPRQLAARSRLHGRPSPPPRSTFAHPAAGYPGGFDVVYESPSEGELTFGQDGPFTVAGAEVSLRDGPRYDNPWSTTSFRARSSRSATTRAAWCSTSAPAPVRSPPADGQAGPST